ncbi:uncharacterized protein LOC124524153 isoform X2 [Lynx rufus]|uniref:uncharacterized protein LOC124524153 isoform X2 n=2 Tax=Lynx rufus TaxID=61384 RepID=UPI001F1276FB|nr:uncharacterized protein LOC124524153 isoform X2 [Lynx rufus]
MSNLLEPPQQTSSRARLRMCHSHSTHSSPHPHWLHVEPMLPWRKTDHVRTIPMDAIPRGCKLFSESTATIRLRGQPVSQQRSLGSCTEKPREINSHSPPLHLNQMKGVLLYLFSSQRELCITQIRPHHALSYNFQQLGTAFSPESRRPTTFPSSRPQALCSAVPTVYLPFFRSLDLKPNPWEGNAGSHQYRRTGQTQLKPFLCDRPPGSFPLFSSGCTAVLYLGNLPIRVYELSPHRSRSVNSIWTIPGFPSL